MLCTIYYIILQIFKNKKTRFHPVNLFGTYAAAGLNEITIYFANNLPIVHIFSPVPIAGIRI